MSPCCSHNLLQDLLLVLPFAPLLLFSFQRLQRALFTAQGQLNPPAISDMVKSDDAAIMDGQPAKPVLIAQACGTCGAELSSAAVLGGISASKRKSEALITDSLWGNLIWIWRISATLISPS